MEHSRPPAFALELMNHIRAASFLLAIVLTITGSLAQPKSGKLRISVVDPAGAVVPGAKILIIPSVGSEQAGYTDGKGLFTTDLPQGDYDVFVSFQVFSPVAKKMRLKAGKTTEYPVKLKFDPLTKFVEVQ